jgi:hypothetical protein
MTDNPRPCLKGCTIRRQHTPNPPDNHGPDTCNGCLPRPAEYGNLCAWCWQRLHADIIDTPSLVRHLHAEAEPHAGAKPAGDGRTYRDPSEGSVVSGAVTAADELHALLAFYAQQVLEEHPNGDQMAGPDERGVWRTTDTWHSDEYGTYPRPSIVVGLARPIQPERRWVEVIRTAPVNDRDGQPIRYLTRAPLPLPPAPDPAEPTARLVRWLLPQLAWCADQEWAGEMRSEIAGMVRTTMARWPIADTHTRHIPATLCPRCDRASLTYTPPAAERAPFVVACTNPECGRVFDEDEWTRLVELLGIAERRAG